ncbi:hypothetical protein DP939_44815 [Spongiactinospora rosea]|uniref:Uncharacterized protein n=1 Tax=Spongiactinospora rosea TaxID=2248750 RepID=A0A366LCU0_9ACTN|nr:hypothetical protein [Spongiactinospora rosea]RBQ11666.1 hypothetical protein DP939_44815 [Spongiactinospora rosea]
MYRVELNPDVAEQVEALPGSALAPFMEVWTTLELNPWGFPPYNEANPDGAMRALLCGDHKQGFAVFLTLEGKRRVAIVNVRWAD